MIQHYVNKCKTVVKTLMLLDSVSLAWSEDYFLDYSLCLDILAFAK
jgi:hypothetical protein